MWKIWSRPLKTTILSTLVIFYILMGLAIFKRSTYNDDVFPTKSPDFQETKTLVGYSMEYQIAKDLKESYKCERRYKKEEILEESDEDSVRLVYDRSIDSFLLSAFYDSRIKPYGYVRVVALVPPNSTLFCQVRRSHQTNSERIVRRATVTHIWSQLWDQNQSVPYIPALISCLDSPGQLGQPTSVSFQKEPCQEPKRMIRIAAVTPPSKKSPKSLVFTICVKPLNFDKDISKTLKEWILINRLLGLQKIIIYYSKLSAENISLLESFVKSGLVKLVKFRLHNRLLFDDLPFMKKTWLKRKLEVLAYNDCFYRNINYADFVIPLDVDEIIVPKNSETMEGMLQNYYKKADKPDLLKVLEKYSSLSVRNAYFFQKYPETVVRKEISTLPSISSNYLVNKFADSSIFNRKIRSLKYSPGSDSSKSLIYVSNTLTIFNHFSYHILKPSLRQIILPTDVVQLNHYRDYCDSRLIDNCTVYLSYVKFDDSLDRFRSLITAD